MSPLPWQQLCRNLVLQMLEINPLQLSNQKRMAKVLQREGCLHGRKTTKDFIEVDVPVVDRDNRSLLEVSGEPGDLAKGSKNGGEMVDVLSNGVDKGGHVFGIQGCAYNGSSSSNLVQKVMLCGYIKDLLQRVNGKDKRQGQIGVTLPQRVTMDN